MAEWKEVEAPRSGRPVKFPCAVHILLVLIRSTRRSEVGAVTFGVIRRPLVPGIPSWPVFRCGEKGKDERTR